MTTNVPPGRARRARRLDALAALPAGAALVAAFAPVGVSVLALLAPALLIHLWAGATRARDAAWLGFAFGLGQFGAGVSWIYVSLSLFGGMPAPLAAFATLAFCAWLALIPAAVGYLQGRIPGRPAVRVLLAIPALWTVSEMFRGWYFTGFPWLALGYAATDTPLAGYAPLIGVYGLTLLGMLCAGLVRQIACGGGSRFARAAALAALVAIFSAGALLRTVEWTRPYGPPLAVSLLQGNVAQEMKFDPERYAKTLAAYAELTAGSEARLIVLPETAIPRFLDLVDPAYLDQLGAVAKRNGGDLIFGVPFRAGVSNYFNSALSIGTSPTQIYSKAHLVPFGEFIPPGFGWIPAILQIPLSDFSRGAPVQKPLAVAGQRVAVNICYEDAFGEEIIGALPDATLLVNISNVAWFGDSLAPAQHLQMARMRSLETGRSMLAATNTGVTAAIDRDGHVVASLPQFVRGRLDATVRGYEGATPYARFGNWPALLAAAMLVVLSVAMRKR